MGVRQHGRVTTTGQADETRQLVTTLVALEAETTWAEYKHNNAEPSMIGAYISALANAAAVADRPRA